MGDIGGTTAGRKPERRYIVRFGEVRGLGGYLATGCDCTFEACEVSRSEAKEDTFTRAEAELGASRWGGRAIPLLTVAEAKRKAAARALPERAVAFRCEAVVWAAMKSKSAVNVAHTEGIARGYEKAAEDAELAADRLWPRRKK